jgi:hypothetical protein
MTSASDRHERDHAERLLLHAIHALPPEEISVAEGQIAACAACQREIAVLRRVIDAFVSWPTDVLRASPSLWDRVAQRIAAETGDAPVPAAPSQWVEPPWRDVAPGISCKLLAIDTPRDRVSMLVRLAPGTDYPPHQHGAVEELHMLQGELIVDDTTFYPGDYRRAEPETVDHRVWSETGCTCVLVTSMRDLLL